MEADRTAPLYAEDQVAIAAAAETVWSVMSDVDGWAAWNPDVTSARLEGPLAPGTRFRWKAGPGTITSTLGDVEPPRRISWSGSTMGIRAIHVWAIEPSADGVVVTTRESWSGMLASLFRARFRRTLTRALANGLAALKAEAERREGAAS